MSTCDLCGSRLVWSWLTRSFAHAWWPCMQIRLTTSTTPAPVPTRRTP